MQYVCWGFVQGQNLGYALPGYVLLVCDLDGLDYLSGSNVVLVGFEVFCESVLDEWSNLSGSNGVLVGFEVFCACDQDGSCNLSRSNGLCSCAVCLLGVRTGAELGLCLAGVCLVGM